MGNKIARSVAPKRQKKWFGLVGCCLVLILVSSLASSGVSGTQDKDSAFHPMTQPIPLLYFNLNILFHPLTKVPWPAVPFNGWRVWHALWADLEPQKGQWHFDLLDKYVGWSEQHHTELLMILAYSPQWASSKPAPDSDWYPGTSGPLTDMEDWKTFVRTVAVRYKGRIHEYEIWNEPNRRKAWSGDVQSMVDMTREASKILKDVDPNNLVVSPAPTGPDSLSFFRDFLSKGGASSVDVIGYHFYVAHGDGPEAMVPLIRQVKEAMHQYGAGEKPLWDTEAGWLGDDTFPDEKASAYVARAFILNWAARVDRFYWYSWDSLRGSEIQLTSNNYTTLTASGRAYATIEQWLVGSVMKRCFTTPDGNWICALNREGADEYLVWTPAATVNFNLPREWQVSKLTQLSGATAPIQGTSISIGIQPVLLQ